MKKILLHIFLILLAILVVLGLAGWVTLSIANRTNGSLSAAGETRRYLLYVPDSYDPSTSTPLVISIHSLAAWPAQMAQISRWNDLADEHGFLVVYPMGTGFPLGWRASGAPGLAQEVAFISGLIDHLEGEYHLDPKRIYVNGHSLGGGLSFALSCELSERIAAIGSVAGGMILPWDECNPSRPEPAIVFHGDADPYIPFEGGPSPTFDFPFPRVDDWVQTLAERNGCLTEPRALPDSGEASGVQYTGCDQGAEVTYYTIHGGGHTWPGGYPPLPEWITGTGYTSDDIDATRLMWDFFLHHPLE